MVKEIRQLAAVMFADIVGFTTMMQQDEEHARALRIRHRQVIDEAVAEHALRSRIRPLASRADARLTI